MIKKTILATLLLTFSYHNNAQDWEHGGLEIGMGTGIAIPLGDFSSESLSSYEDHCSCADLGATFLVKFRLQVKNSLYASFTGQRIWNPYDGQPILNDLYSTFDAPFSMETDSWKSSIAQLGLGNTFRLYDGIDTRLYWDVEASGLINLLDTYYYRIQSPDGSNRYPLRQQSIESVALGFGVGSSLSLDFNMIGVKLMVDYLQSNHEVKGADRRYNGGDLIPMTYDQMVKNLTVQVGVFLTDY